MSKNHHKYFVIGVVLVGIGLFVFRSLLSNITTHLLDWDDYPYYVWTITEQANNLRSLQIFSLGEGKIFYPHNDVLFFSDLLLPQALIASLLLSLTQNFILIFNILFIITIGLNIISSIFFWKRLTTDSLSLFFLSLVTVFSPFIFVQLGHFQMINIWPLLLSLGLLFDQLNKPRLSRAFIIGLLLTLQFTMSVYLAVFLLWIIMVWYGVTILLKIVNQEHISTQVKQLLSTVSIFSVTIFPLLWKYIETQRNHQIFRSYGEYAFYAAHLTDYLFYQTKPYKSVMADFLSGWNKFNQHKLGESATWPGISLTILSITGLFQAKFGKKVQQISIHLSHRDVIFFIILVSGFIFSLGPRLNVNGVFTNIPLPYHVVLKILPLVEPVRATGRWSLLFYLGLSYFAVKGVQKIKKQQLQKVILCSLSVIYVLEIIPTDINTRSENYYSLSQYASIEYACKPEAKVLLEYPMNKQLDNDNSDRLPYKTQMMLTSLHHNCYLVNGYSGFVPKEIEQYEQQLELAFLQDDYLKISELLDKKQVSVIKLNMDALEASSGAQVEAVLRNIPSIEMTDSESSTRIFERKL